MKKYIFKCVLVIFCVLGFGGINQYVLAEYVQIPGLYNTGVDDNNNELQAGYSDLHYTMTGPILGVEILDNPNPTYWVKAPDGSAWIAPNSETVHPAGSYNYTITFDLTEFNTENIVINGDLATDNNCSVFLNGMDTGITTGFGDFDHLTSFTIETGFIQGINTLEFQITNGEPGGTDNPMGLLVANLLVESDESDILETCSQAELEAQYEAGKQYCINNPEGCGIDIGSDSQTGYDQGYIDGQATCEDEAECTQVITYAQLPNADCWVMFSTSCDVPEGWEIVYEEPSNMCGSVDDTPPENTDNCSTFDIFSNTLHVPCFNGGSTMYWLDLELTGSEPVTLELKDLGTN